MAVKRFAVSFEAEVEEIFSAESYWFDEDKGTLKLLRDRRPVAIFPAGAWRYCREVQDDEQSR